MSNTPVPVIFIHGLWLHPQSWAPWAGMFERAGYQPMTPGWPGVPDTVEAARANPDSIANHGIDDVTSHYAAIIAELPTKPVVIGHSFGGMIAEKLLGQDLAAAAIAIDAAQIKGVLPLPLSALRATLPVFKNPANKHRAVALTAEQFRFAFGNAIRPRSPTRCSPSGRSRPRASRCSRPPPRTSTRTHRPRSTPTTAHGARCC